MSLSDAGVALGSVIKVLLEVECSDGDTGRLWFSARVEEDSDADAETGSVQLVYEA